MIKQILLPILGTVAFIIAVGLFVQKSGSIQLPGLTPTPTPQTRTITVGSKTIEVVVAKTKEERNKGLSGTTSLGENSGMLFVFDSQNVTPTFWMKDMVISLDIIWINDGKITRIDKNVQPPVDNTPDNKLKVYSSGSPVDYVLEVNAGFSNKNGLKAGDLVDVASIK